MKLTQKRLSAPSLGGLLATRQGSLLAALLCAVLAAVVLVIALGHYKTHVQQPVQQASVLVATGEITKGMTGTEIAEKNLYKLEPVTASQVTAGALSNAGELTNETASADILPGQQITSTDFSELAALSLTLKPGMRAIEISTSGAQAASDITQSESRVDIYTTAGSSTGSATSTGAAAAGASGSDASLGKTGSLAVSSATAAAAAGNTKLLASNIEVLKPANGTSVTLGNQLISGSTLVLAVKTSLVPALISDSGSLYLVLRPGNSGAAPVAPTTTTTTAGAS